MELKSLESIRISEAHEKLHHLGTTETLQKIAEHIADLVREIDTLKVKLKAQGQDAEFKEPTEWR